MGSNGLSNEIFVVYWSGDQDCDGRNDGPVAVFSTYDDAWAEAERQAAEEAAKRNSVTTTTRWTGVPIDWGDREGIAIKGERCSVQVATLAVRTRGL
jgi:hypothetical protein